MHMDVLLTGNLEDAKIMQTMKMVKKAKNPTKEVEAFLNEHKVAKIVVIVETHASDNGRFVWRSLGKNSHDACTLYDVGLHITLRLYILTDVCSDSEGLHPNACLEISVDRPCNRIPKPQAPEHHYQPGMWSLGEHRYCTLSAA